MFKSRFLLIIDCSVLESVIFFKEKYFCSFSFFICGFKFIDTKLFIELPYVCSLDCTQVMFSYLYVMLFICYFSFILSVLAEVS